MPCRPMASALEPEEWLEGALLVRVPLQARPPERRRRPVLERLHEEQETRQAATMDGLVEMTL